MKSFVGKFRSFSRVLSTWEVPVLYYILRDLRFQPWAALLGEKSSFHDPHSQTTCSSAHSIYLLCQQSSIELWEFLLGVFGGSLGARNPLLKMEEHCHYSLAFAVVDFKVVLAQPQVSHVILGTTCISLLVFISSDNKISHSLMTV